MATAIFFNGRRLNVPQAVTKVDATALAAVSPAAVGTVALVGTAEGGAPLTIREDLADATQAGVVQSRYRSGDLRTAGIFAFEPSQDDAVPGGAQKEILVKVNPATQAGLTLPDGNSADSLDITSKDYGLFASQINLDVDAGTNQGLKYIVTFEDVVETFDDVGGDAMLDVLYTSGSTGWGTALAEVTASQFAVVGTRAVAGLVTQRTADIPAPGVVSAVSGNVGDTTQTLTVYGLSGAGALVTDTLALNGTTPVVGTTSFTKVLATRLSAVAAGTVTVSDSPVTTTLFTMVTTVLTRGLLDVNLPLAGVITETTVDTDVAAQVVFVGTTPAGAASSQVVALTTAATTPVAGTASLGLISTILLGDVPAARTVTVTANAALTLHTQYQTIARVVDRLNTITGFTANAIASDYTTFLMADLDYHVSPTRAPVDVRNVTGLFYADLYAAVLLLTQQSQFVNAARATGADLPPAVTAGAVYLEGGSEGTTTITEWEAALKLLEQRRYNTLVVLSRDPAVHSLALSHLIAKNGRLKSEANGYIGIGTVGGAGETRTNIQTQIQALGSRLVCAISQEVQRADPLTGESTWYPPYIYAAIAAGMQAGSAIAEPLTRKIMLATDIRNDASWNVQDDASALIDRGLMMAEKVDGVGIRWIRSVTTHLADDNLAFTEMSSNESLLTFLFEFREALEARIGSRGLSGTVGSIRTLAYAVASRLRDEEKIRDFRSLQVAQVGDVFPVSIEVALVDPVNFIPITVHLTPNVTQAA